MNGFGSSKSMLRGGGNVVALLTLLTVAAAAIILLAVQSTNSHLHHYDEKNNDRFHHAAGGNHDATSTVTTATMRYNTRASSNVHVHHHHHRRQLQSFDFDTHQLSSQFQIAKAQFIQSLKEKYGSDNFPTLFEDHSSTRTNVTQSIARSIFTASPISWERMKNKVAMKILQAQMEHKVQPFVWATGGHSASAGHGNLFNESYTAILEVASIPLFAAVGLELEARKYAMGGTSSGMEISSCIKEVFGFDVDLLTWDYGMTTASWHNRGRVELYFHRASLLPSRPAFLGIQADSWDRVITSVEALGPAVFLLDASSVEAAIPDTNGKTQEEINQMPPYIRSFRCGGGKALEKGDPTCDQEKYTVLPGGDEEPCNQRHGKASWHPGWKWHALYGHLMTLFLIEIISDALALITEKGSDPTVFLQTLTNQQNQDYLPLLRQDARNIKFVDEGLDQIDDIPNEAVYWNFSYCHTARLPSQIRYQGILTESKIKGRGGYHEYDHGKELSEVKETVNENMPLTWDPNLYELFCKNYEVDVDHQDFFLVNSLEWSTLRLPNSAEQEYYGPLSTSSSSSTSPHALDGYIALCLAACGWSCPEGVLIHKDLWSGTKLSMTVNGINVANYSTFGTGADMGSCLFLQHAGGHKWTANADGTFDIRAKTTNPKDTVRISAIILW